MDQHALVTGTTISGRIPIRHERHPEGHVDVTPDVIYSDDQAHIFAIAHAIEVEHYVRKTHPTQLECAHLDDTSMHPNGVDPDRRAQHQAAHAALHARIASDTPHVVTADTVRPTQIGG